MENNEIKLKTTLRSVIENAQFNEDKLIRLNSLVLEMVGLESLSKFIYTLVYHYECSFQLDILTVAIIDKENEYKEIL